MPCDQVIENSVDLALCDQTLIQPALEDMGATDVTLVGGAFYFYLNGERGCLEKGEFTMRNQSEEEVRQTALGVKRAFAKRAVEKAARKQGWTTVAGKQKNKLKLRRR